MKKVWMVAIQHHSMSPSWLQVLSVHATEESARAAAGRDGFVSIGGHAFVSATFDLMPMKTVIPVEVQP